MPHRLVVTFSSMPELLAPGGRVHVDRAPEGHENLQDVLGAAHAARPDRFVGGLPTAANSRQGSESAAHSPVTSGHDLARQMSQMGQSIASSSPLEGRGSHSPGGVKRSHNACDDMSGVADAPLGRFHGRIALGGVQVNCCVQRAGDRILSLRAVLKCLGLEEAGGGDSFPDAATTLRSILERHSVLQRCSSFPLRQDDLTADGGITPRGVLDICRAFVLAMAEGELTTRQQCETAVQCAAILSACAEVGLTALIDESTGYLSYRTHNRRIVTNGH